VGAGVGGYHASGSFASGAGLGAAGPHQSWVVRRLGLLLLFRPSLRILC
jgi:hypothetical protein